MPTVTLSGVAFARDTVPGYRVGMRVLVSAQVDITSGIIASLNAQTGGEYTAPTVAVLSVEYRTDTGVLLGTASAPGNVAVNFAALQRSAPEGRRLISANIPDYLTPSVYAGTSFATAFQVIGSTTINDDGSSPPVSPTPNGLYGRYYNNDQFAGLPVYEAVEDPYLNVGRNAAPRAGVRNGFEGPWTARWTGRLTIPATGQYRFRIFHDDGARMFLNGQLLIDRLGWTINSSPSETQALDFTSGDTPAIWLEFFNGVAEATFEIQWTTPSNSNWVRIPFASFLGTDGTEGTPITAERPRQNRHYVEPINRY